ncbi:cobalt-precorrin 5A hydrolase [Clostridium sp. BJN0001]|uniref:cobalt-precorrin 5A hydrolase n=1 Tax=Clostridium sp. BJN0001 TaxID=2930219 RepID=UPI001FD37E8A|nr:cobalt-precorrin 5A hydrolase [Clostridium sp. BJN0001]
MKNRDMAVICPSLKGENIALSLKKNFDFDLFIKKSSTFNLFEISKKCMNRYDKIVFISSTGIAVRAIAPFLQSKDKDPAVVTIDLNKKYAISLVSGHLGGANFLASSIADTIKCEAVITTATDNMNIKAPDVFSLENNLVIDDIKKIKYISSMLISGKRVGFFDEFSFNFPGNGYKKIDSLEENSIWITNKCSPEIKNIDMKKVLKLIKRNVVLGIGCRKNTDSKKMFSFVKEILEKNNIDLRAVLKIGSIYIKKDERAIIDLSKKLNAEFITFSKEKIRTCDSLFEKSDFVFDKTGVYSVCEPCCYLLSDKILVKKIKKDGMTLSVGIIGGN